MDEVVRHAGMVRVFLELNLEDGRGRQCGRKRLLGRVLRRRQVNRREDLCLVVLGETPGQIFECIRQ